MKRGRFEHDADAWTAASARVDARVVFSSVYLTRLERFVRSDRDLSALARAARWLLLELCYHRVVAWFGWDPTRPSYSSRLEPFPADAFLQVQCAKCVLRAALDANARPEVLRVDLNTFAMCCPLPFTLEEYQQRVCLANLEEMRLEGGPVFAWYELKGAMTWIVAAAMGVSERSTQLRIRCGIQTARIDIFRRALAQMTKLDWMYVDHDTLRRLVVDAFARLDTDEQQREQLALIACEILDNEDGKYFWSRAEDIALASNGEDSPESVPLLWEHPVFAGHLFQKAQGGFDGGDSLAVVPDDDELRPSCQPYVEEGAAIFWEALALGRMLAVLLHAPNGPSRCERFWRSWDGNAYGAIRALTTVFASDEYKDYDTSFMTPIRNLDDDDEVVETLGHVTLDEITRYLQFPCTRAFAVYRLKRTLCALSKANPGVDYMSLLRSWW